jgi:RNA polymerase sigma-70 factor (ECF subfamily)
MSSVENEAELVAQAVAGDRLALERLLLAHATATARHIESRLPCALRRVVSVDDILQETFLNAFRSVARFEARAEGTFGGWLKAIADARLADIVRRKQTIKRGGRLLQEKRNGFHAHSSAVILDAIAGSAARPSSDAARREAISAVRNAVAELNEAERHAIQAHVVRGESLTDTACAMGRTENAVRGLIHRAKGHLRTVLRRSSQWFTKRG